MAKVVNEDKGNGKDEPEKFPTVPQNRYQAREYTNNQWALDLSAQKQITAATAEKYLSDRMLYVNAPSRQPGMRTGDIVFAKGDDYWAEVLVRQAIEGAILQTHVLRVVKLEPAEQERNDLLLAQYDFVFDDTDGWVVTRKVDNVLMGKGVDKKWSSRADAETYIRGHASVAKRAVVYA